MMEYRNSGTLYLVYSSSFGALSHSCRSGADPLSLSIGGPDPDWYRGRRQYLVPTAGLVSGKRNEEITFMGLNRNIPSI